MTEEKKSTINDDIEQSYGSNPQCNFVRTEPRETLVEDRQEKLGKSERTKQKKQSMYRKMYEQLAVLTFVYAYKCRKILYYVKEERGRRKYPDSIFEMMFNIQDIGTDEITQYRDIVKEGFSDIVSDLIIEYKATYDNKPYNRAKLVNYYILKRLHMRDIKYRFRIRYLPFVWIDMTKVFTTKLDMDLDYSTVRSNIEAVLQAAIRTDNCSTLGRMKHVRIAYSTLEKVFTNNEITEDDIVFEQCSIREIDNTKRTKKGSSDKSAEKSGNDRSDNNKSIEKSEHDKSESDRSAEKPEHDKSEHDKSEHNNQESSKSENKSDNDKSANDRSSEEYISIHSDESSTETEDYSTSTLQPDTAFPKPATDVHSTIDRKMIEEETPDERMTLSISSSKGIGEVTYTITRQSLLNLFANPYVSVEDSTITVYSDDDVRSALSAHRACK